MIIWVNQASSAGMVLSDELVKLKGHEFSNRLGIPENDLKSHSAPEILAFSNNITNNRDQRPEDNILGSEDENGENFISETRGRTRRSTRGSIRERTREELVEDHEQI
ncbi:10555_t:CDS:2 [Dentiscutata heterogama]|uniref:10555_t:CDS:1 n=1 Tax=Dentiscutata heterogama TaxID=1316150 RepID=A0ACA9LYW7_9GLOM|nr:10555_t:CDS:2 [Dentiscutata heterogama]